MIKVWIKNEKNQSHYIKIIDNQKMNEKLKEIITDYLEYLVSNYLFIHEVEIYLINEISFEALDGDYVIGTCFLPNNRDETVIIKIAVGDFIMLKDEIGFINTVYENLINLTHELTHMQFWSFHPFLGKLSCIDFIQEIYAKYYSNKIANQYLSMIYKSLDY